MRILGIIFIFFLALLASVFIGPLFGIREQSPFLIAAIAVVLYFGFSTYGIGAAVAVGIAGELFSGSHLGTLALGVLASCIVLFFLQRLFNIKPLASGEYWSLANLGMLVVVGSIMLLIALFTGMAILSVLYGDMTRWNSLLPLFLRWELFAYNGILLVVLLACIRFFLRERNPEYT